MKHIILLSVAYLILAINTSEASSNSNVDSVKKSDTLTMNNIMLDQNKERDAYISDISGKKGIGFTFNIVLDMAKNTKSNLPIIKEKSRSYYDCKTKLLTDYHSISYLRNGSMKSNGKIIETEKTGIEKITELKITNKSGIFNIYQFYCLSPEYK